MSKDEEIKQKIGMKYVRDYPIYDNPEFKNENVESAMDYEAKDGDVVLLAYPKTGSTWAIFIIYQILHKGEPLLDTNEVPVDAIAGADVLERLLPPRFYKYHIACNRFKVNPKAKYIYLHRKPDDTIVSQYYFMREFTGNDFDFDFYFDAFMDGKVPHGDYLDHVLAAYAHKNDGNFLFVSYEDLKNNTRQQILRMAEFLGKEYHEVFAKDDSLVEKVIECTSFDYMRKNVKRRGVVEKRKVNFFRKGVVGEGRQHLSGEQKQRLRKKISQKLSGTEFADAWSL